MPDLLSPLFLQSVWFGLLCVVAFACMLVVLFFWLRRRLVARPAELIPDQTQIGPQLYEALLQDLQGLMFQFEAVRQMLPEHPTDAVVLLDAALECADRALDDARHAGRDLHDAPLPQGELGETLIALGGEFLTATPHLKKGYQVVIEGQPRLIDPIVWDLAYRLIREAFICALTHAHPAHIEVELTFGGANLVIRIRDDGVGIDHGDDYWGLPSMRERAEQSGGKLSLWSQSGAGTEIELRIPERIAYRAPVTALRLPNVAPPR